MEHDNFNDVLSNYYITELDLEYVIPNLYGVSWKVNELIIQHNRIVDLLVKYNIIPKKEDIIDAEEEVIDEAE